MFENHEDGFKMSEIFFTAFKIDQKSQILTLKMTTELIFDLKLENLQNHRHIDPFMVWI